MLVLGINGNFSPAETDLVPSMSELFFHDAAASLVRDGELVAAVEEERLNRIKKTTKFPSTAIRECLALAGASTDDVDAVGFYFPEDHLDLVLDHVYTEHPRVPLRRSRELIKQRLREDLGWELPDDKLVYVPHHEAHAYSSYLHSGLDEALVVIFDGRGEDNSGTVYHARGAHLEKLHDYPVEKSLGGLYLNATFLLGYGFGDEYKVMGLAPSGDPSTYRDVFSGLYALRDKGEYDLIGNTKVPNLVTPALVAAGFRPRRKDEPFSRAHRDFAAALQEATERIALHVLGHWAEVTGLRALAFGGGVAHNSTLNGRILKAGLFDEVFIHPASHDAGAGEGAAYAAAAALGSLERPSARLVSAALGPDLGTDEQVAARLADWSPVVEVTPLVDPVETAAKLLADGEVLGWAHGRSEFGPRALGHRSIIADARPAGNQTRINAMVKKRESFRPFAPVVTAEAAEDWFDLSGAVGHHEFMSFVVPVLPGKRAELGAVTHVDGSARVQVVTPGSGERFHRLVARFGELTGTPVLLNTSFNNNAEPIAQSLDDVLTSFLTTDLDGLVVEGFLVRARPEPDLGALVPRLRPVTRLATRTTPVPGGAGAGEPVHEVSLDYDHGPVTATTAEAHGLLGRVDGVATLAELAGGALSEGLARELRRLWEGRFVELTPAVG
ncbi:MULTISPECIES: carbamoyltransferase C-terminal domain-containing protein [Actinosynnema]|uniref:carbamoyltransferase family protein n=1 Tax=Actinosynnema TaxID=40566 RepID=UPI0020A3D833|nr:carbamoyltransferase C-terminal domain-containing protein [Actinosynnema pretiosum]MCP2097636.1 7-O-carbamoyltransferase [Actinosynnema pretiosum]